MIRCFTNSFNSCSLQSNFWFNKVIGYLTKPKMAIWGLTALIFWYFCIKAKESVINIFAELDH